MLESLHINYCENAREWVEGNLVLPPEVSPNLAGRVSLARQPWMAEILESFLDPTLEDLYLCMGTQCGKTTACLLGTALISEFSPAPLIWALPTEPLAARLAKTRLIPFIRHNHTLSSHIHRADDLTPALINADNMQIFVLGATSPSKVSSQPAAYIIADEEAKIDHPHRNEAHPVLLLSERTKSFARKLRIHASTPNREKNIFWRGLADTDMRKFFVPCPHCGHYQTLEFTRQSLIWEHPSDGSAPSPSLIHATARYICCECGGAITETDRLAVISRGEWRATRKNAFPNRRGYHLNSLYSPFVSFGDFALAFYAARANGLGSLAYQNFVNSWQSEPYTAYAIRVDDASIPALCDTYRMGEIPIPLEQVQYIFVGYDPGDKLTHWVATVVATGGDMYIIDCGTLVSVETDLSRGVTGISAHINSLSWQCAAEADENGQPVTLRPEIAYVDSGDRAQTVYTECERAPHLLSPSKGMHAGYGTWRETPLKSHPGLTLVTYNDYAAKYELYASIIAKNDLANLHLPADAPRDLIAGLSGQTLEILPSGRRQWKAVKADHYGDCVKLARVSWWVNRGYLEPAAPDDRYHTPMP